MTANLLIDALLRELAIWASAAVLVVSVVIAGCVCAGVF